MSEWVESASDSALAASVVDRFRGQFGTDPEGVWAAPGRVNLIGEHVDLSLIHI